MGNSATQHSSPQSNERGPVQLGQVLTITKRIGKGRLGVMYAAVHDVLARRFAVKVLRPSLTANEAPRDRLRRVVRQTSQVEHPNIVALVDLGQVPDGRHYLTMDYVRGSQLTRLLTRDGRFPVGRALGMLVQLADALDAAHQEHIEHGDLKPNNIMCVEMGGGRELIRVSDWMLAPALLGKGDESADRQDNSVAAHVSVHGSVDYVSPEALNGAVSDFRSDQYALGAIAYHMLTGQPPFSGNPEEVAQCHCQRDAVPPSRRSGADDVPSELDAFVLRCLEKDPGNRFSTSEQLLDKLRRIAPSLGGGVVSLEGSADRTAAADDDQDDDEGIEVLPESVPKLRHLLFQTAVELADRLAQEEKLDEHTIETTELLRGAQETAAKLSSQAGLTENRFEDIRREMREKESVLRYEIIDLNLAKSDALDRTRPADELDAIDDKIRDLEKQLFDLDDHRTESFESLNHQMAEYREQLKTAEHEMAVQFRQLFTALDAVRGAERTGAERTLFRRMERCRSALTA